MGEKPITSAVALKSAHERIDILCKMCEFVIVQEDPAYKAKLMGMLAIICAVDVDEESKDG